MLPLVSHLASNDNHNLKVILLVRECEDFSTDRLMELENDEQGVLKTPSLRSRKTSRVSKTREVYPRWVTRNDAEQSRGKLFAGAVGGRGVVKVCPHW